MASDVGSLRDKRTSLQQIEEISSQEKATSKAQLRTKYGLKETPNSLFSLSVDFYRYVCVLNSAVTIHLI